MVRTIGLALLAALTLVACQSPKETKVDKTKAPVLATKLDSINYAVGIDIGNNLKVNGVKLQEVNTELIQLGIEQITDTSIQASLTPEEAIQLINSYLGELAEKKRIENLKQYEPNKQKGLEFLAKNKEREGVVILSNGVQYEIIKEGTGNKPIEKDEFLAHYTGSLIDGTVFSSSKSKGKPASFSLDYVIEGWKEVLPLMSEGAVWKVYIPQELAYGSRKAGEILPYSALVFEIELLEVIKKKDETN
ncbi:MAG: FKBP-type peptidyl-prolyl cis-trans isomerase [Cytophagales bacterium]|nr:FKBP-type peptidyl-prolyl cis-trans isomerase [Cytophagales bacterium]